MKLDGLVGARNALLGELASKLSDKGIHIPAGFVLDIEAMQEFIKNGDLNKKIKEILKNLDAQNLAAVSKVSAKIQKLIMQSAWPKNIEQDLKKAIKQLGKNSVSIRSGVVEQNLPDVNFSKQEVSFLNIRGEKDILLNLKKCLSALYSVHAILERESKGIDHLSLGLALSVQEMSAGSTVVGKMRTLDTESGFKGVISVSASDTLAHLASGANEFCVFKDGIKNGFKSIISRKLGAKNKQFFLSDDEVVKLSKIAIEIENFVGAAVVINWVMDSKNENIYITEVYKDLSKSPASCDVIENYHLQKRSEILVQGVSVGQKIAQGKVHIVNSAKEMADFKAGEVLVTKMTDADWDTVMRLASAVITQDGGKNSHAAIRAREMGIPCVVGADKALKILKNNQEVTVSSNVGEAGVVYKGRLPFSVERSEIKSIPKTRTKMLINMANPDSAFSLSNIPTDGVGLAREEFIFTNFVKVHPLALVNYKDIKDKKVKAQIDELTAGYKDKKQYGIDKLAEGLAFLATAFYPHSVQVRLSDFKSNEYASLIGGTQFEPQEDNPSMGWRGASRYYDPKYKSAFEIECKAIKKAREIWGLKNIIITVPFCRTVDEGKKVLETMKEFGLEQGKQDLKVYVMCELPANVILAKEFAQIFDGFSIGSNDLTQFTLGVDRDSSLMSSVYDENNLAVKKLIRQVIETAHQYKKPVSICGEAVNDSAEFVEFLVQEGIDGISFNSDSVLKMRARVANTEKKVGSLRGRTQQFTLAAKSFLIIGVLGMSSILGGYGCQTINNQTVTDNLKNQMQQQILEMKAQLRQEITAELVKKTPPQSYITDTFVKMKLTYPSGWSTNAWEDGVKFASPDESEYFMVFVQKMGHPVPSEKISTTTWNSYPAKRLQDGSQKDGTPYEVLEIYTKNYKQTEGIIELRGDPKTFEDSLKKIQQFELKK